MTLPTTQAVAEFSDFVAHLRASHWTPVPIEPPFARFLAVRSWPDGTWDVLVVDDLDHLFAFRESADGQADWLLEGDLAALQRALILLPDPGDQE